MAEAAVRVLIVDDEPMARAGLRQLVSADPAFAVVGEVGSAAEARDAIEQLAPEVVLLDVEMPAEDGFAAIRRSGELPVYLFVTAHAAHAVRAFDVRALDYLLKPFSDRRFAEAMDRARAAVAAARRPERIEVREAGRVRYIDVAAIDWIAAADYYVELHVGGDTILHREPLHALAARLDPRRFVRVHRRAIVNRDRIVEVRQHGRQWHAVLSDGSQVPVARRARDRLR
jgi:two-component system, LytTR family, response regulator